jgi:hypothetical protein
VSEDTFKDKFPEKKKKNENKPSRLKLLFVTFVGFGLLYIPLQVLSVTVTSTPDPQWSEVVSQSLVFPSYHAEQTRNFFVWLAYIAVLVIFCRWAWRHDRVIALIFMSLLSLFTACYGFFVLAPSFGFVRGQMNEIHYEETTYMLISRNSVPDEALYLYRCVNQQCQGRKIGWNDDNHNGARFSIEGEPPQLIVRSGGKICFDIARFDEEMLTYQIRPLVYMRQELWNDGCEDG